jgi:hypothetical protein
MPQEEDSALSAPDPNFRLDSASRDRLAFAFNVDVLERLLAWYIPEKRDDALQAFLELADQAARGEITITQTSFEALSSDPRNPEIESLARQITRRDYRSILGSNSTRN